MVDKKLCPLLLAAALAHPRFKPNPRCREEECAWWDGVIEDGGKMGQCVVMLLLNIDVRKET